MNRRAFAASGAEIKVVRIGGGWFIRRSTIEIASSQEAIFKVFVEQPKLGGIEGKHAAERRVISVRLHVEQHGKHNSAFPGE